MSLKTKFQFFNFRQPYKVTNFGPKSQIDLHIIKLESRANIKVFLVQKSSPIRKLHSNSFDKKLSFLLKYLKKGLS